MPQEDKKKKRKVSQEDKKKKRKVCQEDKKKKRKVSQEDQKEKGKFTAEISSEYGESRQNETILQSVGIQLQGLNTTIENETRERRQNTTE